MKAGGKLKATPRLSAAACSRLDACEGALRSLYLSQETS